MNFLKYLLRHSEKVSSEDQKGQRGFAFIQDQSRVPDNDDYLPADLYFQLSYMSALACSNLSRDKLFEYVAKLPITSSRYIRQVNTMVRQLGYDYAGACRTVGDQTKEPGPKSILLRMAGALATGDPEKVYLDREANASAETYTNNYTKSLDSLRKWTDAHVSLVLAAGLVVVVAVVSQLIFPVPVTFVFFLTFLIMIVTLFGSWLLYRSAPKEIKTASFRHNNTDRRLAIVLFKSLAPLGVIATLLLLIQGWDVSWSFVTIGIFLLPAGVMAMIEDRKIDNLEDEIAAFIRSLGGIAKAVGTTITDALGRLDTGSVRYLRQSIARLRASLDMGVTPELCWQKFVVETGSEHVNRSIRMFLDGVKVGGDPEEVGRRSAAYSLNVSLLRAKRRLVSSGFLYLCLVMHGTIVALLAGIYEVLASFFRAIQSMKITDGLDQMGLAANLPTFQFFLDPGALNTTHTLVISVIIVLTFGNAIAIKVVEGGSWLKLAFYSACTLLISGACLIIVPKLVTQVFSGIGGAS